MSANETDGEVSGTSEPNSPQHEESVTSPAAAATVASMASPQAPLSNKHLVGQVVKSESHDTIFVAGAGGFGAPLTPSRVLVKESGDMLKSLHKRRASDVTASAISSALSPSSGTPSPATSTRISSSPASQPYSQRGAPGKDPPRKTKKSKTKNTGSGHFKFHEYKVRNEIEGNTKSEERILY